MQKILKIIMIACLVGGVSLVGYSLFQIGKGELEVKEKITEAKEIVTQNPKSSNENEPGEVTGPESYQKGDTIGLLSIPKLEREIAIIEGTDPEELEMGVGHYSGTSFPSQEGQIVLSGHRDTVFRNFDQLKVGDTFVVQLAYGEFEYEIYDIEIVPADDLTVIGRPTDGEVLTVTTCYPFSFIGDAPDRAIFWANPVSQSN